MDYLNKLSAKRKMKTYFKKRYYFPGKSNSIRRFRKICLFFIKNDNAFMFMQINFLTVSLIFIFF